MYKFDIKKVELDEHGYEFNSRHLTESFLIISEGNITIEWTEKSMSNLGQTILYVPSHKELKLLLSTEKSAKIVIIECNKELTNQYFFSINQYLEAENLTYFENLDCFLYLTNLCKMMFYEYKISQSFTPIISSLLNSFFVIFYDEFRKVENISLKPNGYVDKLLSLIEENYNKAPALTYYADQLMLSDRQLNNIVNAYFKENLTSLINKRKVVQAKKDLIISRKSISEIGYSLGFNEKSYFSRVFKKVTGMTPRDYQKKFSQAIDSTT